MRMASSTPNQATPEPAASASFADGLGTPAADSAGLPGGAGRAAVAAVAGPAAAGARVETAAGAQADSRAKLSAKPRTSMGGESPGIDQGWYHAAVRVALWLLPLATLGCAAEAPLGLRDSSRVAATEVGAGEGPRGGGVAKAPAWYLASRSWPAEVSFASEHLGGGLTAALRVNPESRSAYLALADDDELPEGTRLVEFLSERGGRPGPVFALHRASRGWEYSVLEADGSSAAEGDLPLCRGCHQRAAAAPVFGLPRGNAAPESGAN